MKRGSDLGLADRVRLDHDLSGLPAQCVPVAAKRTPKQMQVLAPRPPKQPMPSGTCSRSMARQLGRRAAVKSRSGRDLLGPFEDE